MLALLSELSVPARRVSVLDPAGDEHDLAVRPAEQVRDPQYPSEIEIHVYVAEPDPIRRAGHNLGFAHFLLQQLYR